MVDFGALPPEFNSARIYTGPGPGPLLASAAAWDQVAAQLEIFATGYSSVLSELQGPSWSGAASTAMAAAATPYIAWVTTTAEQAGQAAGQARAAAAGYEAAFASTVPPAVVMANRTLLATLVATNFFGQNTPAIAATEAVYAEMWAQDAAAMYGYAASAAAAATLTPFSPPPQTTNPAGQSSQGAAVGHAVGHSPASVSQLMSAVPQQLQALTSGGFTNASAAQTSVASTTAGLTPLVGALRDLRETILPFFYAAQFTKVFFYIGMFITALPRTGALAAGLPAAGLPALEAPATGAAAAAQTWSPQWVLAGAGRAVPVGGLSVPQGWTAEPAAALDRGTPVLPPSADPPAISSAGVPSVGRIPTPAGRQGRSAVVRMRNRHYRMPRPPLGG